MADYISKPFLLKGIKSVRRVGAYDTYQAREAAKIAKELMGRYRQQRINEARTIGNSEERSRQLKILQGSVYDNEFDAFRHCAWNIEMTRRIGVDQAKIVADLHEFHGNNTPSAQRMDYYNNHVGRTIGQDLRFNHLNTYDATLNALNKGWLMERPDMRPGGADGNPHTHW